MSKTQTTNSKSFASWGIMEVEKSFNLTLNITSPLLDEWLNSNESISDYEEQTLDRLQKKAFVYVRDWNETELTAKLISAIFDLVNFDQIKYSLFLERPISGVINSIPIHGKADTVGSVNSAKLSFGGSLFGSKTPKGSKFTSKPAN